jgi:hypothetical protein
MSRRSFTTSRGTPSLLTATTSTNALHHPTSAPCLRLHPPSPTDPTLAHLTFRSPIALPSYHPNPTHDSSAPRRGLADGATEQAPGSAVGSLALAGTSPSPSRHRCRAVIVAERRRRRPQVHGSASQRAVGWSWDPGCLSRCLPWVGRPVRVLGRVHASGVRCPSSVRACDVHASAVQCPGVGVRCPASGVASASAVCIGDLVERVGAAGSHTARRGPGLAVLPHPRTARTSA